MPMHLLKKVELELEKIKIETVSNADGTALKFSDGTMVCYGKKGFVANFATAAGSLFSAKIENPINFPAKFATNPTVNVTTANDTNYFYCWPSGVIRNTESITELTLLRHTAANGEISISFIAIGRWK